MIQTRKCWSFEVAELKNLAGTPARIYRALSSMQVGIIGLILRIQRWRVGAGNVSYGGVKRPNNLVEKSIQ